jgi:predicted TIM-barrel fold metal-dependent hydrolase
MNRREFLGAAAAVTVAGCATSGQPDDPATIPLVDTHQHLWDLRRLRLPWLVGSGPLSRNYLLEDYAEAFRGVPLAQSVYMEVDVAADQKVKEAEDVLALCERPGSPTRAAVIGGRPADDGFDAYLDRWKGDARVKGVRQVLFSGGCLEPALVRGIRLLGERSLSFDLCMPPKDLSDGAKLVDLCPDTRFVVDHCGNADPKAFMKSPPAKPEHDAEEWKRSMGALARRTNVICKISGIVARVPKPVWGPEHLAPVVNACLESFGPDRVVFGSDWPVCTLGAPAAAWVMALREIIRSRPEEEQRKLLQGNAVRFYSLADR